MRETKHYGNTHGAIEVELRKGSVNKIILGTVHRYSSEDQAKGAPMLKFTPVRTIDGRATKQALRINLSQARAIYRNDALKGLAAFDKIVTHALAI